MAGLDQIKPGARIKGLDGSGIAEVVSISWFGSDTAEVVYRVNGRVSQRLVFRSEESSIEVAAGGRAFGFEGDGQTLRLASEAMRIRLAHLFDPYMAVHASRIEALPHQITAVYAEMLPRQPLRFLLADDPGAGKTVMAGLLLKELLIRGDLERCMIVAPGSLVEQWQDELQEKFGLRFEILTRDQIEASVTGNPFAEIGRLIVRLDMAARSEDLKARIDAAPDWDLVICDEAHRMAASYFGGEVKETQRYKLGKLLGQRARNFLLMSATPHNGKEADFQLFMGLLDADRFEGRFREGVHKVDTSDMMRRLTKEELFRFDGTPLFPERRAYTASYELSKDEAALYEGVTKYVREEMDRADRVGDDKKRMSVGFALQILQRRLASSPAAIHRSLQRRRERLEARLREERLLRTGADAGAILRAQAASLPSYNPDDIDEAPGDEIEDVEERIADQATNARTIAELETEIVTLTTLEGQALAVRRSGQDTKWRELDSILEHPLMFDPATGSRRKLLIFTEPKDTLEYLAEKIRVRLGKPEAVAIIHGGVAREARKGAIAAFNDDPEVRVLIANDAAGEGVNLQRGAHLMVNYDLPWNPNRLEQRFGRIHRIGQTEVCHLWNLCAANTREGEVYRRLLEKIEDARKALGGRVYDVLGSLFEGQALRDLLVEAIRYGQDPAVRQKMFQAVDNVVDTDAINRLVEERKLTSEGVSAASVRNIRDEMERAAARRLQPRYIRSFFEVAFERLGGRMIRREVGRYEITRVPPGLRDRDRLIGRGDPVVERYERVTFDKAYIVGPPPAALIAPGHPLLDATVDLVLERFGEVMKQGAVLVDETDDGEASRVMFYLEHSVRDGRATKGSEPRVISQRLQFVSLGEDGSARDGGPAPYLDYRPITDEERTALGFALQAPWLSGDLERQAFSFAIQHIVPTHLQEVRERRLTEIEKVEREVRARLTREITYWDSRVVQLRLEERAGKEQRLNAQNAEATATMLADRLERRTAELDRERQISALPPLVRGGALVVPIGLLRKAKPTSSVCASPDDDLPSSQSRAEVECIAMEQVLATERRLGRLPRDVSAAKCGYDIESRDPTTGRLLFIEVKGRRADAEHVIITRNEILTGLNKPDAWVLAVVRVDRTAVHEPVYVRTPFEREPGFNEIAVVFKLDDLLARGSRPA